MHTDVMTLTACRRSLQARLKRHGFRSDKEKRDKESKSNSSSLGSLKEADLIAHSKVMNSIGHFCEFYFALHFEYS